MILDCCVAWCALHWVLLGDLMAHHVVTESFSISVCDLLFDQYRGFEIGVSVIIVCGERVDSPGAL